MKDKELEELLTLIEEQADEWLQDHYDEFEDTNNPEKPFRTEFAFEYLTEKNSRFKKWSGQ